MTNNKQQTAVEWFFMTMNICGLLPTEEIVEYYNQAKEMEKEHIIKAHGIKYDYSHSQIDPKRITGEQYYNETYGGNK
jgi:hypothetical protein